MSVEQALTDMGCLDDDLKAKQAGEEIEKKAQLKKEQDDADLKEILNLPAGKRFFNRFFEHTGVFINPHRQASTSETSFQCGRQAVGQTLITWIADADKSKLADVLLEEKR